MLSGGVGVGGLLHVNKLTCVVYCPMWYSGALYETYISFRKDFTISNMENNLFQNTY